MRTLYAVCIVNCCTSISVDTRIRLGGITGCYFLFYCKKNLNASRPFEHSVRGENMSKRLVVGIISCKYKTFSWYLNGFPDGSNIGSTV